MNVYIIVRVEEIPYAWTERTNVYVGTNKNTAYKFFRTLTSNDTTTYDFEVWCNGEKQYTDFHI